MAPMLQVGTAVTAAGLLKLCRKIQQNVVGMWTKIQFSTENED